MSPSETIAPCDGAASAADSARSSRAAFASFGSGAVGTSPEVIACAAVVIRRTAAQPAIRSSAASGTLARIAPDRADA